MKQMISRLSMQAVCLNLLFVASASHAEIYKWVDANGKTHYSEKKDDAGKAKVEEVKVKSLPESTGTPAQSWQDREVDFRKRQMQQQEADAKAAKAKASQAKPPDVPYDQNNDASRCALAKDILSGKAVHGNGAKTDANDKSIAERDKSTYCR